MRARIAIGLVAIILGAMGCSKDGEKNKPLGEPVPATATKVTIQQVVEDRSLVGKTVVLEGRVGGVGCVDCGGVLVTDKTWRVLVEPEDKTRFQIPANSGARVRVWGVVEIENDEGEEHEEGEAHEEAGEDAEAHAKLHKELDNIALEAKGVEWL